MGYSRTKTEAEKEQISNKMKAYWSRMSEIDREKRREKVSTKMKQLWSQVPRTTDQETQSNW